MKVTLPDGRRARSPGTRRRADPGWCKLDWVVADPTRGPLANASNVLDADLGGARRHDRAARRLPRPLLPGGLPRRRVAAAVQPARQASCRPTRSTTTSTQLEHEVWKYTVKEPNYGKAARRMYNVFRLTGRYAEAAYLRELFDEPTTALYQVAALIRTLDEAASAGRRVRPEMLVAQADQLIMSAIAALEGPSEAEMVGHLLPSANTLQARGRTLRPPTRWAAPGRRADRRQPLLRAGPALGSQDPGLPRGHRQARAVGRRWLRPMVAAV